MPVGTIDPIMLGRAIVDVPRLSARTLRPKIRLNLAAILWIDQSSTFLVGLVVGRCDSLTLALNPSDFG